MRPLLAVSLVVVGCSEIYSYDAAPTPGDAGASEDVDGPAELVLEVLKQPHEAHEGLPLFPPPTIGLSGPGAASAQVTLSIEGGGTLEGLTSRAAVDGVAVFEGLSYRSDNGNGNKVELEARSGEARVVLDEIGLIEAPPGKCNTNDERLTTAEGGCHDRTTGLTWSSLRPSAKWHAAVWDATFVGSPRPNEDDFGRTNDYPEDEVGCPGNCDEMEEAVCHALEEGARTDWRLPSLADLTQLHDHMGGNEYIERSPDGVWTSDTDAKNHSGGLVFLLQEGLSARPIGKHNAKPVICVRGGRKQPAKVKIIAAPFTTGNGSISPSGIEAAVVNEDERQINAEGIVLTLSSSPSGALSEVMSGETNQRGRVSMSGWTLKTSDDVVAVELAVTAPELVAAVHEITIGAYRHTCRPGPFETTEGGCRLGSLVFSAPMLSEMTWDEAIWDSTVPGGEPPDLDDGGATDDYDKNMTFPEEAKDRAPLINACHSLEEGGKGDWRVPTVEELTAAHTAGAWKYFGYPTGAWFWSSSFVSGLVNTAKAVWLGEELKVKVNREKDNRAAVLCVRPHPNP